MELTAPGQHRRRTRLFTVVSWVMLLSLQHRNAYLLHGGDMLMAAALFRVRNTTNNPINWAEQNAGFESNGASKRIRVCTRCIRSGKITKAA